jgi:hypothetical protein
MALKTYEELREFDISKYTEKRDGMDYLNWAKCVDLLHENGAKIVYFEPLTGADGSSLFMSNQVFTDNKGNTNRCYEVAIKVVVDENEWIFRSPLMNGANPVKDNSMSQQRVWNCQTRAFVKCIAIHTGLGFNLWLKEEAAEVFDDDDLSKHNIMKVKERIERLLTIKMDNGLSLTDICSKLNIDQDQFNVYMKHYTILDRLEKALAKL